MSTVHILTQYIWPDAAPTGLYAEQLAARLHEEGSNVRLVGGKGSYRSLARDKPPVAVIYLDHYQGRRGNLKQTMREYASVQRAFGRYVDKFVRRSDVVIVTSAPPNSIWLAGRIQRREAKAVYWLQDYYPELIRGIYEYPWGIRRALSRYWDHLLSQWDRVVKIGNNLGGPTRNSVVIRNWPTISFEDSHSFEPKTALYSGNLGYGHDVDLLIAACEQLRERDYRFTIRADGRGAEALPAWLRVQPLHDDPEKLKEDLIRHETHLVAGHPRIQRAIFPSKIWNSIAAGRSLICTGFAGEMAEELEVARSAAFETHIDQWVSLLANFARNAERAPMNAAPLSGQELQRASLT